MEQAVRKQNKAIKSFCKACFSGVYPTRDVTSRILRQIEREREYKEAKQKVSHIDN